MTDPQGTNSPIEQGAETRPHPPRFWWLKRLSLAGLFLIVALTGLRWWWGYEAQRRINVVIAEAHAKGEPILPEDFDSPGVPDEENAAIPLKQAEAGINWSGSEWNFDRYPNEVQSPPSLQDFVGIRAAMQLHARELQLIRAARARPQISWDVRIRGSAALWTSNNSANLNSVRSLARFLNWSAQAEHATGNDAEAIEYMRDTVFLAKAQGTRVPNLIATLVDQGLQSLAAHASLEAASSIKLSGANSPAREDQIRALIVELLEESPAREASLMGWRAERLMVLESAPLYVKYDLEDQALTELGLPAYQLFAVQDARRLSAAAEAALQPNFQVALSKLLAQPSKPNGSMVEFLAQGGNKPFYRRDIRLIVKLEFAALAERRAAALMLALRLYSEKHQGHLPTVLAGLVPDYLPAVPADPFAADGTTLRFLPFRDPPAIYSVGENGTDEGGSETVIQKGSLPWNTQDAVFPLRFDPPKKDSDTKQSPPIDNSSSPFNPASDSESTRLQKGKPVAEPPK